MYRVWIRRVLAIAGLASGALACSSTSGGDGDESALALKCGQMCEKLVQAPLSGCGKSDGTDVAVCKSECLDHVSPGDQGEPPEADEGDVDCAIAANDCDTWKACGDLL